MCDSRVPADTGGLGGRGGTWGCPRGHERRARAAGANELPAVSWLLLLLPSLRRRWPWQERWLGSLRR